MQYSDRFMRKKTEGRENEVMVILIRLLAIAVVVTAGVVVQVFLSKRRSKWPGLVLVVLSLAFSIIYVAIMTNMSQVSWTRNLFGIVNTLVEFNIPTLAFYIIYRKYHKSSKKR